MKFIVQTAQPTAQFLADLGVERTKGFVKEKNLRLHRQSP